MGHLINPISTRLGLSTFWISSWSIFNLKSYSYYMMIDNLIIALVNFFFSDSKIVRSYSKVGFFFSHFRFIRRGLGLVHLRLFFALKSSVALAESFVEKVSKESFFYYLRMKAVKISGDLLRWACKYFIPKFYYMAFRSLLQRKSTAIADFKALRRIQDMRFYRQYVLKRDKQGPTVGSALLSIAKDRQELFDYYSYSYFKGTLRVNKLGKFTKFIKFRLFVNNFKFLSLLTNTFILCNFLSNLNSRFFCYYRFNNKKNDYLKSVKIFTECFLLNRLKVFYQRFVIKSIFARLRRLFAISRFSGYLSELYSSFFTSYLNSSKLFINKGFISISVSLVLLRQFKLLNPQFLARFIAKRLSYGMPLRHVLGSVSDDLISHVNNRSKFLKGFRIKCSGRFNRTQMASVTVEKFGCLSLSALSSTVGYGYATAFLRYGSCGIKVWLFSEYRPSKNRYITLNKLFMLRLVNLFISQKGLSSDSLKTFHFFRANFFNKMLVILLLNSKHTLLQNNNYLDIIIVCFLSWFLNKAEAKKYGLKAII